MKNLKYEVKHVGATLGERLSCNKLLTKLEMILSIDDQIYIRRKSYFSTKNVQFMLMVIINQIQLSHSWGQCCRADLINVFFRAKAFRKTARS
jgi:hypothetical protein